MKLHFFPYAPGKKTHTKTRTQSKQNYRASDILDNLLLYDRSTFSIFKELSSASINLLTCIDGGRGYFPPIKKKKTKQNPRLILSAKQKLHKVKLDTSS